MNRNHNHIEPRNEHVQELLEAVPNWMIRYGNTLILLLIVLLFVLSWFIKYPDILTSEVQIITKLPSQEKYAKTTGKFDTILVHNNAFVSEGDVLAIIENTANYNHIQRLKSTLDTIQLNTDNFNFPLNDLPILFLGEIDSEYVTFENNYLNYRLNNELQPFANEQNGNKLTKTQLYSRLKTLKNQKQITKSELSYFKKDLERQQLLFAKGVIAKQTIESKELEYLNAERNYANIDASISQIKEAISKTNTNEVSTSIKQTKERIRLLKNVIQSFNQLKIALQKWEMKYTITSDINGKVVFSESWSKNQAINDGDLICTIIPENNTSYIAKLESPAHNSGKIKKGQFVNVSIENYPEAEFGSIQGQVESISLLTNSNGNYVIDVILPQQLVTSYNKSIQFKYGMRGKAKIITEDLRVVERLFYQLKNVFKN